MAIRVTKITVNLSPNTAESDPAKVLTITPTEITLWSVDGGNPMNMRPYDVRLAHELLALMKRYHAGQL
jgi:hypothetical protein